MSHHIECYHNGVKVSSHQRCYGKHEWVVKIEHYLDTFHRKPGALAGSVALASSGYLKQLYQTYFIRESRNFISLLEYCREHCITDERLQQAVNRLSDSSVKELTTEKIKALLGNKQDHFSLPVWTQTTEMAKSQLQQISALIN